MAAPHELLDLVARFEEHREAYRSGAYNEAQARIEFIDPMFKLLGWDMNNEAGYAEQYKDVIHEHSIKREGGTEAPDYCFRIGGTPKFFLEAKKPSVNLKDDISPAFQIRRYAWTIKLALSVLTDFEEFAVYDCRVRPDKNDKASTARTFYLTYRDYAQRWDEIAAVFSREAILKGSFDKYAASSSAKRGTAEVDDVFLQEIESWRDLLARNIALRNPSLTQRDLNFAVQTTIDRIIFLRICEGRGIEEYGRLLALTNGNQVYARLCSLFQSADERYNSGLFHFRAEKCRQEAADELSLTLAIDDKPLKDIIKRLYYPDSPYEFSVLPADILGQVYEQFLGKVIRLTEGHHAVIEDKPEVKKAGGVYYTPTYIVDYIVEHTVGKQLQGKTPAQAAKLRILDPACGSGSFLIVAYQRLLDWHVQWYTANDAKKWAAGRAPAVQQRAGGDWRLTTGERKRILLNNIYGVDIDVQAVEVTKLSLLLKVLEGESEQTLAMQLRLIQERALPDLSNNIKCGNSLIGPDFYDNQQMSLLGDEERYRINVFDWRAAFPQVFAGGPPTPKFGGAGSPPTPNFGGDALPSPTVGGGAGGEGQSQGQRGGFDVVIGNPPYIRIQALKEWAPVEVEFYKKRYIAASKGNYDIYVVFVERGLSLLNARGRLGFILPNKFFNAQYGEPLRTLLAQGNHLAHVVHFGDQQVFHNATTYTCLMFLDKAGGKECDFVKAADLAAWRAGAQAERGTIPSARMTPAEWNFTIGKSAGLFEKLSEMPVKLGDVATKIFQGLATSADSVYVLAIVKSDPWASTVRSRALDDQDVAIESDLLHPLLKGAEITRYGDLKHRNMILFPYRIVDNQAVPISENDLRSSYPLAHDYLSRNKRALLSRSKTDSTNWWLYPYPKNLTLYEKPKILSQVLSARGNFGLDLVGRCYFLGGGTAGGNAIRILDDDPSQLVYMLGILNSRLTTYWVSRVASGFRGGFYAFGKASLTSVPIRTINFADAADTSRHDQMVAMVERMLAMHKQLGAARTAFDKESIQRQIEITDKQIDRLVYELYGLTAEEIAVVEGRS
jgi:hypothetical protein